METLLGPLFVVDVFLKTFFVVPYNTSSATVAGRISIYQQVPTQQSIRYTVNVEQYPSAG